jgi:uncharacterized membrane protein YfcA
MFLEIATTIGAVMGAILAIYTPVNIVAIMFGVMLIFSAAMTLRKKSEAALETGSKWSYKLKLNGSYPTKTGPVAYKLENVGAGFSIMTIAGMLSGLLGIGSGALKVLAMDTAMKVPFRVSTTTSNFMVGVTAAASAVVYLQRGYIDPGIAFPVIIGVLAGAFTGSKLLMKINVNSLKLIFSIAITMIALNMIYNGLNHKF